jgi:hypothetical protein
VLLERAREIVRAGQGMLDFGVPVRVTFVDDVADWRAGASAQQPVSDSAVVGSGRTVGTASRVLYDVLGRVCDRLGFGVVADAVFRDLVIARIVEPTSKLDSLRVLADLGAEPVAYPTVMRHLRQAQQDGYRDLIAAKCFAHAAGRGDPSLILYDVTTVYFEAEKEDDLRKSGSPRNVASIRRSSSGCWSTATGSRSRSAASKGTRQKRRRSSRSSRSSKPATVSRTPRW